MQRKVVNNLQYMAKKKNPAAVALGKRVMAKYGAAFYKRIGKMGGLARKGEASKLAEREGITRQAAWWRLNRSTGKPKGRPRKTQTLKRTKSEA